MKQDAIDKLQDKIIAPRQDIYISYNDSDETGDGTNNNPYKTIDYAKTKIKEDVPNIYIILDNRSGSYDYEMTAIDWYRIFGTKTLTILCWNSQVLEYRPTLVINRSKVQITDDWSIVGEPITYAWGNIILNSFTYSNNVNDVKLILNEINIRLGTRNKSDKEAKVFAITDRIEITKCTIDADDYSLWLPKTGVAKEFFAKLKTTDVFGYLVANSITSYTTDPSVTDGGFSANREAGTVTTVTSTYTPTNVISSNSGIQSGVNVIGKFVS